MCVVSTYISLYLGWEIYLEMYKDDQYENPNMNNKDHLFGQLTSGDHTYTFQFIEYISLVCRAQAERGLREVFVEARRSKSLGDFLQGSDTDPPGSLQHLCSADGDQREGEQGREGLPRLHLVQ